MKHELTIVLLRIFEGQLEGGGGGLFYILRKNCFIKPTKQNHGRGGGGVCYLIFKKGDGYFDH